MSSAVLMGRVISVLLFAVCLALFFSIIVSFNFLLLAVLGWHSVGMTNPAQESSQLGFFMFVGMVIIAVVRFLLVKACAKLWKADAEKAPTFWEDRVRSTYSMLTGIFSLLMVIGGVAMFFLTDSKNYYFFFTILSLVVGIIMLLRARGKIKSFKTQTAQPQP